ncbi:MULTISPECIES: ribokinase [unclassified Undibacterium]|uniref:ribokinase n=1 Tax=unclassified Undibacterium TaxID=2630295 RepID=UPI002AC9B5DA|nr:MULTISPECIES: ribokinase [unclassified Undibacterium]MEB0140456.1 ribokinase [Undibacterium sp. CCC2.1]MEB0173535.1 ribokinase [Undibacterium sp. CCC1.1]MEB0177461.1 ribokinase [Undibacterium sp. CCC3.4]MEB0214349.1 ribokinase [Undibacterium sp. 5I2]WPX44219.1 ribokinase [Undibacterium sp. CCC3.4]
MKPSITVVGSVNMDLVFRTPRMPAIGETLQGREFHQIPGGKGANQAVAAARQGAQVQFIGAVGADGFGEFSRHCLAAEGIDLTHLTTVDGIATGVAGILVADDGNNSIVIAAGANATLSVTQVEHGRAAISAANLLICQLETPLPSVTRAIEIAHAAGVPVILNPAPAQALNGALLKQVDYLILNETEATQLSGVAVCSAESAAAAAQALLQMGAGCVILTMGGDGTVLSELNGTRFLAAITVDVVDTTAAGDTFVGAFAVGLASGLTVFDACTQAQYAAALTVTQLGAQTSIPQQQAVVEFMTQRSKLLSSI